MKSTDMYQLVTNQVIEALERGVKPWLCPWERNGVSSLPFNFHTKSVYSGINIMLLWASASKQGFLSPSWLTYKQAIALGGNVRKGEKGTQIIFYKSWEKENAQGEKEQIPMMKIYSVFNADQIDNIDFPQADIVEMTNEMDVLPHVEYLLIDTGANITEVGERAFYRPSTDDIVLPLRSLFSESSNFYATALHELTHWTGHKNRLNRGIKNKFGSKDYAFEELVAELGSAFLMAELSIAGEAQHDSYIASWLEKLNNDKRFIFKAASAASKAHQHIMSCSSNQRAA